MSHVSQPNQSIDRLFRLRDRAAMMAAARHFFASLQVCEVDCPALSQEVAVDAHIDLISAYYQGNDLCYLHSSPEMGMKRLLAEGMGDIYQLSHVFRDGEWSERHNPEFMMVEWYRIGWTISQMIEETLAFIQLFLGMQPHEVVSYRALFLRETGLDPLSATSDDLFAYVQRQAIPYYPAIYDEGKDALLNLILGSQIESHLGREGYCVVTDYPPSQAALAQRHWCDGYEVAERFEIYHQGVELANGFHELGDAIEQRLRFEEANAVRMSLGKSPLPMDEAFLKALENGFPDCCGVAVGFDRLMMLRHRCNAIAEIMPCGWPGLH